MSDWFSVEDGLPEFGVQVLVAESGYVYIATFKDECYGDEDDYWVDSDGPKSNPDYWMPLPKPPADKGGEK